MPSPARAAALTENSAFPLQNGVCQDDRADVQAVLRSVAEPVDDVLPLPDRGLLSIAGGLHEVSQPQLLGISIFIDIAQADAPHSEKEQPHIVEPPPIDLTINEAHPPTERHFGTLVGDAPASKDLIPHHVPPFRAVQLVQLIPVPGDLPEHALEQRAAAVSKGTPIILSALLHLSPECAPIPWPPVDVPSDGLEHDDFPEPSVTQGKIKVPGYPVAGVI